MTQAPRRRGGTLAIALGVQGALLALSVFVIVTQEKVSDPPVFEGEHLATGVADRKQREIRTRELQRRMSRPRSFQRLVVESSFASDQPPAPAMPEEAFEFDNSELAFMESSEALLSESGIANLSASLAGRESAAEFFGVKDSGRKIVVVVNTSASVVRKASNRGVSIEKLQEETLSLIDGLDSGTLFGIVQFSQGSRRFAEHLAPALRKNKRLASEWVKAELRGNPKIEDETYLGHEAGLREALLLRPDLIFLVTDGSLNRRTRKSGGGYSYPKISFERFIVATEREMRENAAKPRIHIVGFELGEEERDGLKRYARRFGGSLREF